MGPLLGPYRSDLRNGDLKIREDFQEKGLELLVGAVDLIDEHHDGLPRVVLDGFQEGSPDQKIPG